jgi:hypothetical protein
MSKFSSHLTTIVVGLLLLTIGQVAARLSAAPTAPATVSTAITYQGRLMDGSLPAHGSYDLTFRLYDAPSGGAQIGSAVVYSGVAVQQGLFTVQLDFGPHAFSGEARYLEVQVGSTTLAPRQPLTPAPAALYANSAPWNGLSDIPADLADGDDDTTYTAGNGLILNGTQFQAKGSPFANTIVVASSGGDYSSIQAALDSITNAGADNPYLVYVATGVYTEQVTLKPFVTLEGAGEGVTIIRWIGNNPSAQLEAGATLLGATHASLRHLSVERRSAGQGSATAIYNNAASPRMSHVTATASGGSTNYGIYNNNSSSPMMSDVTATASGGSDNYGVANRNSSSPTMSDVTATASGGSDNYGVSNSSDSSPIMRDVTASASGSTNNFGVYNNSSSPMMSDVTATASGGSGNFGVYNFSDSSPNMNHVRASAWGGSESYGVYNSDSSPEMNNVSASASSNSASYGVYNSASSLTMSNVTASALNGATRYGVYSSSTTPSSSLIIRESLITGETNSVHREGTAVIKVANSQLLGPISPGVVCLANYDANLAAITCP